ncbi:MAG: ATP-dependent protease subunit HslV [Spirochaetia bacterium]|nr:ATP-dependent protease subunit HslV [Spirochaetota bacterium]MCX8096051.1 ATP-dependent protease subunit HslV [Spirochaetota bacterium]MDW8111846.1 ATP-dependent protease subunit HslV [Spirochaetia bacterium]
MSKIKSTTVIGILKDGKLVIGGDGQVTYGNTVLKSNARKIRKIFDDKVLVGFAGATADALALLEKFEEHLRDNNGNILKASVSLAKEWRTDRLLRRLEALMIVGNKEKILILSGTGDVIEPEDNIAAIGSGGPYALASARAFLKANPNLDARYIVEESLKIAGEICIFTNKNIIIEEL